MLISEAFPSNYIKAADLQGRNVIVKMDRVSVEKIGDDEKPILYFVGKEKGLVLNKTNAGNIATIYGNDTTDWRDQEIVLFPAMVDFQGKTVEAVRVRGPQPKDRRVQDPISSGPQQGQGVANSYGQATGSNLGAAGRNMPSDEIPF